VRVEQFTRDHALVVQAAHGPDVTPVEQWPDWYVVGVARSLGVLLRQNLPDDVVLAEWRALCAAAPSPEDA
jgi:hypothetical protein